LKRKFTKILGVGLTLALLVSMLVMATPVLASGNSDVVIGDVVVEPTDDFYQGSNVVVSGTITVSAEAEAGGFLSFAITEAEATYDVYDPLGGLVFEEGQYNYDGSVGWFKASSESNIVWNWSETVPLRYCGDYIVNQYGAGSYLWGYLFNIGHGSDSDHSNFAFESRYDNRMELQVFMPFGFGRCKVNDRGETTGRVFAVGEYNDVQYAVEIPAGTVVVDREGMRPLSISITDIVDNVPVITPSVTFSQPCMLYQVDGHLYQTQTGEWVGGTLVQVGTFTK